MYFSENYTTKWHDTDAQGVVRPTPLLVYMQETANLQCRASGMDLDELHRERRLAFLLSRIRIRCEAPLRAYERITVRTWRCPSRGLSFLRCFAVYRGEERVAEALSTWALMDLTDRSLLRVQDFTGDFPMDDPVPDDRLPPNLRLPLALRMEEAGQRRVAYSDLDYNGHMNNTRYPDMLCDFLPCLDGQRVASLSLSYLREASAGDTLTVYRRAAEGPDGGFLLRAVRPDGQVCVDARITLADCPTPTAAT